jgi:transcriptional regulator with XRE-family HTH domain
VPWRAEGDAATAVVFCADQRPDRCAQKRSDMQPASGATFGELLREHRLAAELTQERLAERAGLSVHGIQKLERGVTRPYRHTVQRLILGLQLGCEQAERLRTAGSPTPRQRSLGPRSSHSGPREVPIRFATRGFEAPLMPDRVVSLPVELTSLSVVRMT